MAVSKVLSPLALKDVRISDDFWSKYMKLIQETVIPYQWEALNDRIPGVTPSHCVRNYRIAAGLEQGEYKGVVFQDSDLAKWLEAVAYNLEIKPDPELEKVADGIIDIIQKAQQSDGYLNTYYTLKEPGKRWTNFRECHELYCAGHLIEAAVAYFTATGKRKLLDVVCKLVDYIDTVIGPEPGKLNAYPGHQEIELALFKLYKITGNERYLKLSKYFLDERGKEPYYFDIEAEKRGNTLHFPEFAKLDRKYAQTHLPVRQQTTAEGHAVRGVYMYASMADIAAETGDMELYEACRKIWQNIVTKRMYITGGIGSSEFGEAFTMDYDLPNDINYAETCASIGLMFFSYRMLLAEKKGCYADVIEKALYNTVLDGISLEGNSFFYVNPLEVWPEACEKNPSKHHVKVERQKWFGVACCPPNVSRTLLSLGRYIYSKGEKEIYINLYIGSQVCLDLNGQKLDIRQETNYPWDGVINIFVASQSPQAITLALRIPGWCSEAKLKINGEAFDILSNISDGYVKINRVWNGEDKVELDLSMPVMLIEAHPNVRADAGKVAIQRGPLIYCLEEVDNGANLQALALPADARLEAHFEKDLLGGIITISGEAERIDTASWGEELYRPVKSGTIPVNIKAVPYCLWNNRSIGEMLVWIRKK